MTLESVIGYIRQAKLADPTARLSDFQIRVESDHTILVNLKTGEERMLPAVDGRNFAEFEERLDRLEAAGPLTGRRAPARRP
jgi:hypothetical protein